MTSSKIKTLSIVGTLLCVLYVLWPPCDLTYRLFEDSNRDFRTFHESFWAQGDFFGMLMLLLISFSLVLPWFKFFKRMRREGRFSPWMYKVESGMEKFFCILYTLLCLILMLLWYLALCSALFDSELLYSDEFEFIFVMFFAGGYLTYLFASLLLLVLRRALKRVG